MMSGSLALCCLTSSCDCELPLTPDRELPSGAVGESFRRGHRNRSSWWGPAPGSGWWVGSRGADHRSPRCVRSRRCPACPRPPGRRRRLRRLERWAVLPGHRDFTALSDQPAAEVVEAVVRAPAVGNVSSGPQRIGAEVNHQVPQHLLSREDLLDRPGGQQRGRLASDRFAVVRIGRLVAGCLNELPELLLVHGGRACDLVLTSGRSRELGPSDSHVAPVSVCGRRVHIGSRFLRLR